MINPAEPCDFDRISVEELPQAKRIAEWMSMCFSNMKILDVGCGPGIYVHEMLKLGLDAYGVDNDPRTPYDSKIVQGDVVGPYLLPQADVVLSLEVGEHIPEVGADNYVNYLAETRAVVIYFSAARPGQGGEGHINTQPKAYWCEKFYYVGFYVDPDATDAWLGFMRQGYHLGWITQNGIVLRRAT
jgi:SAM-dependent methyltransferase